MRTTRWFTDLLSWGRVGMSATSDILGGGVLCPRSIPEAATGADAPMLDARRGTRPPSLGWSVADGLTGSG